jgi:hypothetical protein
MTTTPCYALLRFTTYMNDQHCFVREFEWIVCVYMTLKQAEHAKKNLEGLGIEYEIVETDLA